MEALSHLWTCLHVYFLEGLAHHTLTLVVINSHKLVVLLLIDLMRDDLAIDDGTHAEGALLVILLVFDLGLCFFQLLQLLVLGIGISFVQ